jgi:XXXCH domain-containing protein
MGEKKARPMQHEELADMLEKLAGQLRSGGINAGPDVWELPDNLKIRIRIKEKYGARHGKLEWFWPPSSKEHGEQTQEKEVRSKSELKEVKKSLARSFKELKRVAEQTDYPGEKILEEFLAHSRAFAALAEPEWEVALKAYADHVENLRRAVHGGDKQSVIHELNDLQRQMVDCHKVFR